MSLASGLSVLFIRSKNQLLALLIFVMVSFVSFAFISALIFKISFLLLTLGFLIPSIFSDHNAVRLDLNYRRKTIQNSNIWRLNNTLLNNQQITEEIKKEIKICIETNENENTTTQNLWDTVKAVLRGKFTAIQAYLKKQEKSQINNLTLHLKQLEKEEMKNPRVSRRKEILKIIAEINAKEIKETIAEINKAKIWLFEKITKLTNH